MNKKFCPLPWIFQAIRNNGDIRVCCQANASKSKGTYYKENGEPFNAKTDNLAASRNAALAKEIRLSMLANIPHEACIRCDNEDNSGIESRRKYETEEWKDEFTLDDAIEVTNLDGSIDVDAVPVRYYDLRFGNLCNLKCRMCGPTDSIAWYNDYVNLWHTPYFYDSHGKIPLIEKNNRWRENVDSYNWMQDSFWSQLEQNLQNITHIYFAGGEPMLIEKHLDVLKQCIELGIAKNITLEYNTNLTIIHPDAFNIWKHFKLIRIGVSLDAANDLNTYIRHPSKFADITQNLHNLDKAEGNFQIWLACTVQIYNIGYLPEFITWIIEQQFQRIGRTKKPLLTTHLAHNPPHLNVQVLPQEGKDWVKNKFNTFLIKLPELITHLPSHHKKICIDYITKLFSKYSNYMDDTDQSFRIHDFWKYTTGLDILRSENFATACPELYDIIKRHI